MLRAYALALALGLAAAVCGLVLAWGAHTLGANVIVGALIAGTGIAWLADVSLFVGVMLPSMMLGEENG